MTPDRTPVFVSRDPPDVSQPERYTGNSPSARPTVLHPITRTNAETTPSHGSSVRCIGHLLPTVRWATLDLWDGWNPWRSGAAVALDTVPPAREGCVAAEELGSHENRAVGGQVPQ